MFLPYYITLLPHFIVMFRSWIEITLTKAGIRSTTSLLAQSLVWKVSFMVSRLLCLVIWIFCIIEQIWTDKAKPSFLLYCWILKKIRQGFDHCKIPSEILKLVQFFVDMANKETKEKSLYKKCFQFSYIESAQPSWIINILGGRGSFVPEMP